MTDTTQQQQQQQVLDVARGGGYTVINKADVASAFLEQTTW